jgi:hypothetical protein
LQLKQFAAYTPGSLSKVKRDGSSARRRRHHTRVSDNSSKESGHNQRDRIYATVDGQVVSWDNNIATSMHQSDVKSAAQVVTAMIDGQTQTWLNNWFGSTPTPVKASDSTTAASHITAASKSNSTPFFRMHRSVLMDANSCPIISSACYKFVGSG